MLFVDNIIISNGITMQMVMLFPETMLYFWLGLVTRRGAIFVFVVLQKLGRIIRSYLNI